LTLRPVEPPTGPWRVESLAWLVDLLLHTVDPMEELPQPLHQGRPVHYQPRAWGRYGHLSSTTTL
jgi:hypothetical protein